MNSSSTFRTVAVLGVIEIFAWGSSFYLMAVLAAPMAADTGWSPTTLSAGVSFGLLISGLAAPLVGRLIARHGGRPVLASGMLLLSAGLGCLGSAESLPVFFAAWLLLGLGMSAGLYDAAFSTLGRIYGHAARSPITQLTLWGGFASTLCWPLSAILVEEFGWRGACFVYAALHLSLTLPLALLGLPVASRSPGFPVEAGPPSSAVSLLDPRFLGVASAGVILAMVFTNWSVHLVTLLKVQGYTEAAAIAVGTLIGPAQVGARVLEMFGRGRHHPIWTMLVATASILLGLGGLLAGVPASLAMIAYGAGNGLWSIARGSLPLALFGAPGYAHTMGLLATPILVASAIAPPLGAWMIESSGPHIALGLLVGASIIPVALALVLLPTRHEKKPPCQKTGPQET